MARKLSWSPQDIEATASYIERDSLWYAQICVSKILAVAESILDFPESGRIVPEIANASIREKFVYSYRVIYRPESNRIVVAAVIHGSGLLEQVNVRVKGDET